MKGMAEIAGIKYTLGDTDSDDKKPDDLMLEYAMRELKKSKNVIEDIAEEEQIEETPNKKGIMQRRESI